MNGGYMGKILLVNLSNNEIKIEKPDKLFYRMFLGGVGIGVRHLFTNMPANVDPLGLENILGAYRHAAEQRYRFYSYGDAMLIS